MALKVLEGSPGRLEKRAEPYRIKAVESPQPVWLDALTDPESGASCLLIEFKAADSLEKNLEVLSELRRRHLNPYVTFDFRVIEDV